MVWGGIPTHGRNPLMIVENNINSLRDRDETVRWQVIPFHHDNQCKHARSSIGQTNPTRTKFRLTQNLTIDNFSFISTLLVLV